MTYKILHGLRPNSLRHKFFERSMISEYETRSHRDKQIPQVRLEYAKRGFYSYFAKRMKFLKAFEHKSHLLALKNILESTFCTFKVQTRTLRRRESLNICIRV